jgi:hypothetical protein
VKLVVAIACALASALLAGEIVLMLRRWRNDVLFRHGQPALRDVARSRELFVAMAVVGSGLGLLGQGTSTIVALACAPAISFIALTAVIVFQQSRARW